MNTAAYFAEKAAQCRRLAAAIDDDHATVARSAMAEEFESLAAESAAREGIGF
jgi:hypothetical protein